MATERSEVTVDIPLGCVAWQSVCSECGSEYVLLVGWHEGMPAHPFRTCAVCGKSARPPIA